MADIRQRVRSVTRVKFRVIFELTVLSAALLASCLIVRELLTRRDVRASPPTVSLPKEPLVLAGAPMKGSAKAPVMMVIYSDFQCPFCATFARETLPIIERDYVDKSLLALAFQNLPLERIHPFAFDAAVAGLCANQQGRFWSWHDSIFQVGQNIDGATIRKASSAAGIPPANLTDCLGRNDLTTQVRAELQQAHALGIRSTPAFLLGKKIGNGIEAKSFLSGARPVAEFKSAIESIIAQSKDP